MRTVGRFLPLAVLLTLTFSQLSAQAPPSGRLVPADPRAAAIVEFDAALESYLAWSWTDATTRARRAVTLDSTFGIARSQLARLTGGPTQGAEMNRAAADAAKGPAAEALYALALRESLAGRVAPATAAYKALVELTPNDPRMATEAALALAGRAEIEALRAIVQRFPDYTPAKYWLAFGLLPFSYDPKPDAPDAVEALKVAQQALEQAPKASGSHTALAYVLMRSGREDDALQHLGHASAMSAASENIYVTRAEILQRNGKHAESRAALDSAILLTDHVGRGMTFRWYRALTFLHEGNAPATTAALEQAIGYAQSKEAVGAEATAHLQLALIHAGLRNTSAANEHIAHARRLNVAAATLADNNIIVAALTGQAGLARSTLADYIRLSANAAPEVRDPNVHRMTGLTLLAEGKPAEAIEELRQGGLNPYSSLGVIEAYRAMGKKKEADAEYAAFAARKYWGLNSSATPIVKYRAKTKA